MRAITPALQQLEQRLGARLDAAETRVSAVFTGTQQVLREISERVARVENRVEALTSSVGVLAARFVSVEVDLAEIKGRLGRMSTDLTRGATLDADRYAALLKRVEALEASLNPERH